MSVLEDILSQEIIQKLGWTLIHFVWQAVVVALLLAILLKLLQKSTANVRYIMGCLALGLIVLLPVITMRLAGVSAANTVTTEPACVELVTDDAKEVAITEMPVPDKPAQVESIAAAPSTTWKEQVSSALEPALPYIVSGWLVGVFGLSIWNLGGWTLLQKLKRRMV